MSKKYRNEWKYICHDQKLAIVKGRISAVFEEDKHVNENGKYIIHSLYFDDYKDTCIRENDSGDSIRFKYRIRYYGNNLNTLKLERKEKINAMCYKESCKLTINQFNRILNNDIYSLFYETDNNLLKQFLKDMMTRLFKPKVIIDYERIPYVEPITNIRITLDTNISASLDIDNFLNGGYILFPVQNKQFHVLEVKFDYILPSYIKHMLDGLSLIQSSFSKYYYGRETVQSLSGIRQIVR